MGIALALVVSVPVLAQVAGGDPSDLARNLPLACELVNNPALGATSRSKKSIEHLANRCEIVGTDIEFQSRRDSRNRTHDYAFVGTMGYGFQIFDVTNPANPQEAGGGGITGWQNDIQVRGNVAVSTYDGVSGEGSTTSTCLKTKFNPLTANDQGIDIFLLNYNRTTAKFTVNQATCVANPPGGTHNATIHPSGTWIALSNCCSDWSMDVVDLTRLRTNGAAAGTPPVTYRFIDASRSQAGRCPPPDQPQLKCVVVTGPGGGSASGLWQPHDISFSRDGNNAYVAAIKSTFIVDVSRARSGQVRTIAIIPNQDPNATSPDHNIATSHQADVTPDGRILLVSDEKGGGLSNTQCNTTPDGEIGGIHFFALARLSGVPKSNGASPSSPKKLGTWIYPNPLVTADPLPRAERACTVQRLPDRWQRHGRPRGHRLEHRRGVAASHPPARHRPLRRRHVVDGLLARVHPERRDGRGRGLDLGQHARLEHHAGRGHLVVEGVQGLHLHGRHDPRLRRLQVHQSTRWRWRRRRRRRLGSDIRLQATGGGSEEPPPACLPHTHRRWVLPDDCS